MQAHLDGWISGKCCVGLNSSGSCNDCVLFYGKPVKEISYTNEWLLVEESLGL